VFPPHLSPSPLLLPLPRFFPLPPPHSTTPPRSSPPVVDSCASSLAALTSPCSGPLPPPCSALRRCLGETLDLGSPGLPPPLDPLWPGSVGASLCCRSIAPPFFVSSAAKP
jgi:hypothetical protein